jgi:hypothetical protein
MRDDAVVAVVMTVDAAWNSAGMEMRYWSFSNWVWLLWLVPSGLRRSSVV